MTLNHLKTDSTKLAHYRLKIWKVIEFFDFQSLMQHPLFSTVLCGVRQDKPVNITDILLSVQGIYICLQVNLNTLILEAKSAESIEQTSTFFDTK